MRLVSTDSWKQAYPGAIGATLAVRGLSNPPSDPALDETITRIEEDLRSRFAGQERSALRALPVIQAYTRYYDPFKKTYHVQLQVESVAWKGKGIPSVSAAVTAMFAAELKNMLLTAGHDLDTLAPPLRIAVADGSETYTLLNGQEQTLKAGDMYMADTLGVISSILYGPDQRTRITPQTHAALFAVYAPAGIGAQAVHVHLAQLGSLLRLFSPDAQVDSPEIIEA